MPRRSAPLLALATGALLVSAPAARADAPPVDAAPVDAAALGAEPNIVVVTRDEDGDLRERKAWIADVGGALYIRTTPASGWGKNFDREPAFALRWAERELAMRAERVRDDAEAERVNARFREKYGFGDAAGDIIRFFSGGKKIYRVTPEEPKP